MRRIRLLLLLACCRLAAQGASSPATVLEILNRVLCNQAPGGFVTCCCALFPVDGTVTLASAGHPAPYAEGREAEIASGLPLGIVPGVTYAETTLNSTLTTFISDGISEATNGQGEMFGFAKTQDLSQRPAQAIADAARVWGQNDDTTVVTVRRPEYRQAAA